MNCDLRYPVDSSKLMRKKRAIRRQLLSDADDSRLIEKRIAILGGSTTSEFKDMLELFLLDNDIRPVFYESDFGKFWEDCVFSNQDLDEFAPEVVYVHTSTRNLNRFPGVRDSYEDTNLLLDKTFAHFERAWEAVRERFSCPVILNNFEMPELRMLGHLDGVDCRGGVHFVRVLNDRIAQYVASVRNVYLNDLNYISACYGLDSWYDNSVWYLYRYACAMKAIPLVALNIANIIKSQFGKNKKCLVCDLDNTLWAGVIGDDGIKGIDLSEGSPQGEAHRSLQSYIKRLGEQGTILAVDSKNDREIALEGLKHPDTVLGVEEFASIQANWECKDLNIRQIALELNIAEDSLVFLDDSPVERKLIQQRVPDVAIVPFDKVEDAPRIMDRSGYFALTELSEDDLNRNTMYQANAKRRELEGTVEDYETYLSALDMRATIGSFKPINIARITQLINKTNQFNVTTVRVSQEAVEGWMCSPDVVTLCADLSDCFGNNGIVSALVGSVVSDVLTIDLWVMSCRVFRRGLEDAMMDSLMNRCRGLGIDRVMGVYVPTKKNKYVQNLFQGLGFTTISVDETGGAWEMRVSEYENRNHTILVEEQV